VVYTLSSLLKTTLRGQSAQSLTIGIFIGAIAVSLALLLVIAGPVIAFGAVLGMGAGLYILTNLTAGLYAVFAVVALLPFATLPVRVALTPTILDLALAGFLLVYLFQWMTAKRPRFRLVPAGALILLFAGFMLFSFVAGLGHAALTANILRKFAEMVVTVCLPIVLIDVLRDAQVLRRATLVLVLMGAAQALIGVGLYALNDTTAERALNALGRFGYPQGGVIRYVEDDPSQGERAIGTWVDPNAYGGFLLMIGALAGVQALSTRPVTGSSRLGRGAAWGICILVGGAVLLTGSRGALLALGVAVLFVAVLRYRWLLVAGVIGGLIVLSLPFMQRYLERLSEGFAGEDLATQMRFGEYKDALTLIGRYPLIGVGFAGSPDRDIYLGVSSTYLKIAGATGLTGLGLFLLTMAEVFRYGLRRWRAIRADPDLLPIWLGATAGIVGALISGVVDHYYFNLEFQGAATMLWVFVGLSLAAARTVSDNGLIIHKITVPPRRFTR